jgi:eukaryotic translation initiation factor 2C
MKPFVHYFEEKYGYDIQHTDLPCLEVGTKHMPILVPMEVSIIGNSYSMYIYYHVDISYM